MRMAFPSCKWHAEREAQECGRDGQSDGRSDEPFNLIIGKGTEVSEQILAHHINPGERSLLDRLMGKS